MCSANAYPEINSAKKLNPTNVHQILFAPIGTYATSTASLHVKIKIDVKTFFNTLDQYEKLINININYKSHHNQTMQLKNIIANAAKDTIHDLYNKITSIFAILPSHNIVKRSFGFLLNLGGFIAATAFGTRNAIEIQHIANEQHKLKDTQNFILDTVQLQQEAITHIDLVTKNITALIEEIFYDNPAVFEAGAQRILFKAKEGSDIIIDSIQQAQNHRLAVNLLPYKTVIRLFEEINNRAKSLGYQPLIENANDLFQIDTSYLSAQDHQLMIIVHVPLVKEGHKYELLRYIPFPLSQTLAHNASITPKVDKDLIAFRTKGGKTEYKIMRYADLEPCDKLGQNYRCDDRSILQTQLDDTCLGSLYHQNLPGVLAQCEFEITTQQEHVFELSNSNFLVSTHEPFHTTIECGPTSRSVKIERLSQLNVQGGCQVQLRQHILRPELDLFMDFKIVHFEWMWDPANLFPAIHLPELSNILQTFRDSGIHTINVQDIKKWRLEHQTEVSSSTTLIITVIVIIVLIVICAVFSFYYKGRCYRWDSCVILPRNRHQHHPKTNPIISPSLSDIQLQSIPSSTSSTMYPSVPTAKYELRA